MCSMGRPPSRPAAPSARTARSSIGPHTSPPASGAFARPVGRPSSQSVPGRACQAACVQPREPPRLVPEGPRTSVAAFTIGVSHPNVTSAHPTERSPRSGSVLRGVRPRCRRSRDRWHRHRAGAPRSAARTTRGGDREGARDRRAPEQPQQRRGPRRHLLRARFAEGPLGGFRRTGALRVLRAAKDPARAVREAHPRHGRR
jgi:hypothetical protein